MRMSPNLATVAALAVVVLTAGAATSCAHRSVVDPDGIEAIRTYRFACNIPDPQPAWNPQTYLIAARTLGGFALLQEGQGRQELFESTESRQTWFPAWIDRDRFVFGPMRNVTSVADGRVVPATDGLTVVGVEDNGLKCSVRRDILAKIGFRPRPADGRVYAQVEDKMISVDLAGKVSDAGEGFYPEPQRGGQGIAWQGTPILEADLWTGRTGIGQLFIRWRKGEVTTVPGGCEARWTADGGVVCTVLRGAPQADRPWWSAGTDVWYIPARGHEPVLVAKDARTAEPHPREPIVAVTDGTAGVRLVSLREPRAQEKLLVATGGSPRWSADGTRLLTVERQGDQQSVIVVHVLKETRTDL